MDNDDQQKKQVPSLQVNLNPDTTQILYTDNIIMSVNDDGLVLDICQKIGSTNQLKVVSRVGMSKNHAKKFLKHLGELLAKSEGVIETGKKIHRA